MSLIRINPNGQVMPRGFGICYWDRVNDDCVIAPLGLNVLIAAWRWAYAWIAWGLPRAFDRRRP